MTIELGGKKVELTHVGRNHSDNSIVMRFPRERVLFAVDFISVNFVGFRDFPDAYIEDWIESLKKVEAMDFDILAPGHGPLGRKEHVRMYRTYMEDLRTGVDKHLRAGKPMDEINKLVKMGKILGLGRIQTALRPQRRGDGPPHPDEPPGKLKGKSGEFTRGDTPA